MIQIYDVVSSAHDLNEKVPRGCQGTVLMVYTSSPIAFEVEFVDKLNETLDVLTIKEDDIMK